MKTLNTKLLASQTGAEASQNAEEAAAALRKDVETLLTEIEDQKMITTIAKTEKARQENDFTSEITERLSQQEAQLE